MNEVSTIYNDGMFSLAANYSAKYNQHPEAILLMLFRTKTPLEILQTVYKRLVGEGDLNKIESLDQEEKNRLFKYVKSNCPGVTVEKSIELCRAVWLMENVIKVL